MKTRKIAIITRVIVGDKINEFTSDKFWGRPSLEEEISLPNDKKKWGYLFKDESLDVDYQLRVVNSPLIFEEIKGEEVEFIEELKKETDIDNFFKEKDDNLLLYHTDDEALINQIENEFSGIQKRQFSSVKDTSKFYEPVYQKLAQLCQAMLRGEDVSNEIKVDDFHELLDLLWSGGIKKDNLETKLQILHACLTPRGAEKVAEIDGFDKLENQRIDGVLLSEYINTHFSSKDSNESLTENYVESLAKLRDELLED